MLGGLARLCDIKLKFYEPEEEVRENCQALNCAYVNSTGTIWTLTTFTQFLPGIIASRVRNGRDRCVATWCRHSPLSVFVLFGLSRRRRRRGSSDRPKGRPICLSKAAAVASPGGERTLAFCCPLRPSPPPPDFGLAASTHAHTQGC